MIVRLEIIFTKLDHFIYKEIFYDHFYLKWSSLNYKFVRFDKKTKQTEHPKSERTEPKSVPISKPNRNCNRTRSENAEIRTFRFRTFTVKG